MTFLPIVERELRVAARRRGHYWTRFTAALIGACLCAWIILALSEAPLEAGARAFTALAALAFVYTAIAGLQATADCLSEEKREGTLGLLFLTDLKAYDIVLGKLAARSVNTIYGLLAVLPVLAIPLLLGGVNSAQVGRVALAALNLLFFFLALGLFASARCRQDHVALALAAGLALFLVAGIPLGVYIWFQHHRTLDVRGPLTASPASACFMVFDDLYTTGGMKPYFWLTVVTTHLYGWIFLGLACLITPRSWQEQRAAAVSWRDRWSGLSPETQTALAPRPAGGEPIFLASARNDSKRLLVWLTLAICLGGWMWLSAVFRADMHDHETYVPLLIIIHFLLKCWIALEAAQAFFEDRRSGALELLLATPLTERAIVQGQRLALWRQFSLPIAVVILAYLALLLISLRGALGSDRDAMIAFYAVMAGSLVMDALALSWWSMWLGLSGRKPNRAALLSLAWILGLPVVAMALGVTLYSLLGLTATEPEGWVLVFWWCGLGLFTDACFILSARARLFARFRELAATTPGARRAAPAPTP